MKNAWLEIKVRQVLYGTAIGSLAAVGLVFVAKEKLLKKIKKHLT